MHARIKNFKKVSPDFTVDGKSVFKASAANVMFAPDKKGSSRERLQRVQGYSSKSNRQARASSNRVPDSNAGLVCMGDPFATLVRASTSSGERVCLAVCVVSDLIKHNKEKVTSIDISDLHESKLGFSLMRLQMCDSDAASGDMETWRGTPVTSGAGVVDGQNVFILKPQLLRVGPVDQWTVSGCNVDIFEEDYGDFLDLGGVKDNTGKSTSLSSGKWEFGFSMEILRGVLEMLESDSGSEEEHGSKRNLPLVDVSWLPYRDPHDSSKSLLVAENQHGAGRQSRVGGKQAGEKSFVVCKYPGCQVTYSETDFNKMRGHVGGHILREEEKTERCGMCGLAEQHEGGTTGCGLNVQVNQSGPNKSMKVTTKGDCSGYPSKKQSGTGQIRWGSAAKQTNNAPCTNTPIECVACDATNPGRWVWKYNMALHYSRVHSALECPSEFTVTADEREKVLSWSLKN